MSIPFGKKYKHVKSENFDEFLKELGVNFMIRKVASTASSTVELVDEGNNTYSFNTISSFRTQSIKFQPGVEFIESRMDGEKVPCVITFEGNKMIHVQKGPKTITMVRTFTDDELFLTITIGDLEARRWFKAC